MRCEEVMHQDVEFISPQDTIEVAARKMQSADVGFLPVCKDENHVIGTLTDRDIVVRALAKGCDLTTLVAQVMTKDVVSCRPDSDTQEAQELMRSHQISRMLCLADDGRLVGVISLADLARQEDDMTAGHTLRDVKESGAPAQH